jgi:hypothetical protein
MRYIAGLEKCVLRECGFDGLMGCTVLEGGFMSDIRRHTG